MVDCKVPGCNKPEQLNRYGMCGMHYKRQYRHGTLDPRHYMPTITADAMAERKLRLDATDAKRRALGVSLKILAARANTPLEQVQTAVYNRRSIGDRGIKIYERAIDTYCKNLRALLTEWGY